MASSTELGRLAHTLSRPLSQASDADLALLFERITDPDVRRGVAAAARNRGVALDRSAVTLVFLFCESSTQEVAA